MLTISGSLDQTLNNLVSIPKTGHLIPINISFLFLFSFFFYCYSVTIVCSFLIHDVSMILVSSKSQVTLKIKLEKRTDLKALYNV